MICDGFYLPAWCSIADYILKSLSLKDIKAADWLDNVDPFWHAVIRSNLPPQRFHLFIVQVQPRTQIQGQH
ncbi:hypothetical protein L1987_20047 [Smallanthus sonchifolius]|uniref:Uncharacterized protein n=1 Tax=Smallanthus sonchifolius TaxID=185202 RepID=A0ACB9IR00_9ASTR|nr:hypothetical protein L1987_20047 [Smallanthus sonchifolius]